MLKMIIGFAIFAALAIYVVMQGGDSLDMAGEKHEAVEHKPAAAEPAPAAAPAPAAEPAPAAAPAAAPADKADAPAAPK